MKFTAPLLAVLGLAAPTLSAPATSHTPYPTPERIAELFKPWETDYTFLSDLLADNATWEVRGSFAFAGIFSKDQFIQNHRDIAAIFGQPLQLIVNFVFGGGDSEWASVECRARDGTITPQGRIYNQTTSFLTRWEGEKIVETREYLDSHLAALVLQDFASAS